MAYRYGQSATVWEVLLAAAPQEPRMKNGHELADLKLIFVTNMCEADIKAAAEQWAEDPNKGGWRKAIVKHCSKIAHANFSSLECCSSAQKIMDDLQLTGKEVESEEQ